MQRDDVPTLTPEDEAELRVQVTDPEGPLLFEVRDLDRVFRLLDASRARVRELECDLEAISATLDRALAPVAGTPPAPIAERVRDLAESLEYVQAAGLETATELGLSHAHAVEMAKALEGLDRDARPANWNDGDDPDLEAAWRRGDAVLARYRAQAGGDGAAKGLTDRDLMRLASLYAGGWWYPAGETDAGSCEWSPADVIDSADLECGLHVVALDRALPLPPVYAAVCIYTDDQQSERGDDDPFTYTLHATEAEALAALEQPPASEQEGR